MPNREERTFKVIKGAKAGSPARTARRRAVARRIPAPAGDVTELLERLDQEPVEEPATLPSSSTTKPAPTPADSDSDDESAQSSTDTDDEPVGSSADGDDEPAGSSADDADEAAPPSTDDDDEAAPSDGTAPGRRRILVALLVVVLAGTLTAAGIFTHRWYTARSLDQAHQAAIAAAKQTTVNFVSVSAASVDRDLQRISAAATGEFKDQFTRGQPQVRTAVVENKVESHGAVLRAGLISGDRRSAVVLVAVDATVKNVKAPEGRPSHYRIQVDLVRDKSGRWLVSRLQFVG